MLTIAQWAEINGYSLATARKLARTGKIPGATKLGRDWRVIDSPDAMQLRGLVEFSQLLLDHLVETGVIKIRGWRSLTLRLDSLRPVKKSEDEPKTLEVEG